MSSEKEGEKKRDRAIDCNKILPKIEKDMRGRRSPLVRHSYDGVVCPQTFTDG